MNALADLSSLIGGMSASIMTAQSAAYMAQQQSQSIAEQAKRQMKAMQNSNIFGVSPELFSNFNPYYEETDYGRALMELDEEFPGLRE